ncbi:MAG: hypothetical protein PW734_12630 [Verrucomicrobium sp.]|nr:hypothetical protein [Verrucomicrobium sp.]
MTPLRPLDILVDKDDVVLDSTVALLNKANDATVNPCPRKLVDADWDHWTAGYLQCIAGKQLKPGVPILGKDGEIYLSKGTEHFMASPEDTQGVNILNLKTPELLNNIDFIPGAKEAVAAMIQAPSMNPFFVTAVYPPESAETEKSWKRGLVQAHFPELSEKLHFDLDKSRYQADVMVDDGVHNHRPFRRVAAEEGRPVLSLIVNREMSKDEVVHGAVRVDNLAEAAFIAAQVAEQRRRDFEGVKRLPGGNPDLALKVPQQETVHGK